jgi:hypothetical protein
MKLTKTWRRRIDITGGRLRWAARTVGFTACSVVALNIMWGWITNKPIDVASPARTAVNRTEMVGAFAVGCVERGLTATQAQQHSLGDCWTTRDPVRLPKTPAVIIGRPRVAAVTLQDDRGFVQQWSVVVTVSERPYEIATPHDKCYRIPVLYSNEGVHATLRPAVADCVGPGADIPLGYPIAVPPTSPAFVTVVGFVTSYLTPAGGLDRFVTAKSGLLPAASYRFAKVAKLVANHPVPDHDVPAEGSTVRVIAAVDSIDSQDTQVPDKPDKQPDMRNAYRHEDYPLTLTVTAGRWSVSALDYAPLLAKDAELTPVVPNSK